MHSPEYPYSTRFLAHPFESDYPQQLEDMIR